MTKTSEILCLKNYKDWNAKKLKKTYTLTHTTTVKMYPHLLPFEDFFTYLQQQGFELGVDDFLKVQVLLNRLPEDCPPERLRRLLCPLLANNQDQQASFYQAFDSYFGGVAPAKEPLPSRSVETPKEENLHTELDSEEVEKELGEDARFEKYGEAKRFTFWGFITSRLTWVIGFGALLLLLLFLGLNQNPSPKQTGDVHTEAFSKPLEHESASKYRVEKPYESQSAFGYWWLVWTTLLVGGGIVLYRSFKEERNSFYLEAESHLKPPKYWNIQIPKTELKFQYSPIFKQVSQQLQQRQRTPTTQIDVAKTVAETIKAAGFPRFRYLKQSTSPEYLILLPQSKYKDQQLQLFEMWYQVLKEQEVWVHRFFYKNNQPELCTDENGNIFHLKELHAKHGDCRLLVFASLNDFDLKKSAAAMVFWSDWSEKALLSIGSPSKEAHDLVNENNFFLLPAKLESLTQINSIFEGKSDVPVFDAVKVLAKKWEGLSVAETVRELKRTLNEVSFQWLCATALYPEMNWDLTVYIGEALFDERELVKEANVMPLVNLPWFRKGSMPDALRVALTGQLEEQKKSLAREALLHLLRLNPLVGEEYSEEFFDYQLHIALEDAQLHPEDAYKLSTLNHLTEQEAFLKSRYQQIVLRYLKEKENIGKDGLQLSKTFKKYFKRKDIDVHGIITSLRTDKIKYVYPKVDWIGRGAAAFVDVVFSAFLLFVAGCIGACFGSLSVVIVTFGVVLWAYLGMDSWTEGTGFGKYSVYRVIDVRTNKPCSFWQSAVRRLGLFAILYLIGLVMMAGDIYIDWQEPLWSSLLAVHAWVIGSIINAVYIFFESKGRRPADYMAHTQVIREEDYQDGNFEVESLATKKVKQVKSQMTQQDIEGQNLAL